MSFADSFKNRLHSITNETFEVAALEAFHYQWTENRLYQQYAKALNKHPGNVQKMVDIPFLPISFFKSHPIKSGDWKEQFTFLSSGTTSTSSRSAHKVRDMDFYLENAKAGFEDRYGSLSQFVLLALLPSYQQQGNSSLIAMVDHFMTLGDDDSRYLTSEEDTYKIVNNKKTMLIGVSYALLDAHDFPSIEDLMVMETGGMKGRRKEMIRTELHEELQSNFGIQHVASEYGMTELLSQAYAPHDGLFRFPPWARALTRDINDPFTTIPDGFTGGLNVIDLANIDTCCFIETQDLTKKKDEFTFEILGRFDNSDIRGCNLMIQ